MVLMGFRVGQLLKKTGKEILDDNVPGLSAQLAYFFFFSIFPLFLFLTPLLGLIGDREQTFGWIMDQLSRTVPQEALALFEGVLRDVVFSEGAPGVVSLGAVLALWAGSNIFNQVAVALNRAFDIEEHRPFWKRRLIAIAAVIASGIVVLSATTIMVAGEQIVAFVAQTVGLEDSTRAIWNLAQYPLAFGLLTGLMFLLYRFLPNLKGQDWRHVLVGAVVTSLVWVLVTLAFRFYVQNFANYNRTYGTIGGVIVMMLWMYLSMFVVLAGGELIAEMHHGSGAVKPRTGATYTGRLSVGDEAPQSSNERVERVEPNEPVRHPA